MYRSASIVKDAWHRCPLVIVETQAVLNTDTLVLGTLENSRNAFRKMQKNSEGILDCKFLDVLGTSTWLLPFPEFPALNGLYLTIFVVSPMASGFLNSWDTLARDLRADARGGTQSPTAFCTRHLSIWPCQILVRMPTAQNVAKMPGAQGAELWKEPLCHSIGAILLVTPEEIHSAFVEAAIQPMAMATNGPMTLEFFTAMGVVVVEIDSSY
jgi:hypothetical protein